MWRKPFQMKWVLNIIFKPSRAYLYWLKFVSYAKYNNCGTAVNNCPPARPRVMCATARTEDEKENSPYNLFHSRTII